MAVNVIKHDSAVLFDHHRQMFVANELHVFESGLPRPKRETIKTVSQEGLRGNWLEALNLTDECIVVSRPCRRKGRSGGAVNKLRMMPCP
ncbi:MULTISPECIES: hypothetical protein [unclassified Novosphingobium]|uniref:hypothetical protein n=1 Tax=unclassified Novosphingobium TaxID=2644732 RepID=UPI00146F7A2C|nr:MULTISPECIES: hypothetical protein [unclassified Novosphingobium]NMN06414.1 hypothetical protein [Novosphingobium sp. SG919]NMN89142.1 hypothetical protein [Novosphingobium sp. SG916]